METHLGATGGKTQEKHIRVISEGNKSYEKKSKTKSENNPTTDCTQP